MPEFDIRIVRYNVGGLVDRPLLADSIEYTDPFGAEASTIEASVSPLVYSEWPRISEVAVERWNGADWIEVPNGRFLIVKGDEDERQSDGNYVLSGVNLIDWALRKNTVHANGALTEGKRRFATSTPGAIMKTLVDEGHGRVGGDGLHWAPWLTYDFTASLDSSGVAWPSTFTLGYTPGVTAQLALSNLLDQAAVERRTIGRKLQLFRPDHGVDYSDESSAKRVRLGQTASAVPTSFDISDLVTHMTISGDEGLFLEVNNTVFDALGRLEAHISQGGVSDPGTATLLAQRALFTGSKVREQVSVTEPAATATYLPWVDYENGDWVEMLRDGEYEPVRVYEIVVRKDKSGVFVTAVLNDRFVDLLLRLAKRTVGIDGGAVNGGSGSGLPAEVDYRRPKVPAGLVVESNGYWSEGIPLSQAAAEWLPVEYGENNVAIDIDGYELWGRTGTANSVALTYSEDPSATWSPFEPESDWHFKVRARSASGVWGHFSPEVTVTMERPLDFLEKPTAPSVNSYNGVLIVQWDGRFDTDPPSLPPLHFRQVNVEVAGGEADDYTLIGTLMVGRQRQVYGDLAVGSTGWVRLVAVDRLGRESDPSDATEYTIVGINGEDILADTIGTNQLIAGSVTTEILSSELGDLIISSSESIVLQAGQIADLNDGLEGTQADLADLRLYVRIDSTELSIGRPDSDLSFAVSNERAAMRQGGVDVSWWEATVFNAPKLAALQAQIGNHLIEPAPTGGTVFRALG